MKFIKFFLCLCLLTSQTLIWAQRDIQEQIRMHVDKELYMSGEMLWGKVYVQDALFGKATALSKYVYLELWNAKGSLILQQRLQLKNGSTAFSFEVPQKLTTSYYSLRAYTKWMANRNSSHFAQKVLRIFNPKEKLPLSKGSEKKIKKKSQLNIYPEGGTLFHGLETRVGVKVRDEWGQKKQAIGRVELEDGSIVAVFESNEEGLASFHLQADSNQSYRIRLLEPSDSTQLFELGAIKSSGISLKLLEQDASLLSVALSKQGDLAGKLFLSLEKGGYPMFREELILGEREVNKSIGLRDFPKGECMISVRNERGRVLAWRYIWTGEEPAMNLSLKVDKSSLGQREKFEIEIETKDAAGNPCAADLSLQISKQAPFEISAPQRLTDELSLLCHEASYKRRRTFFYPEMYGLTISGSVKGLDEDKLDQARVVFSLPGKEAYMRTMRTNEEGRFNLVLENFYGVREIGLLAVDSDGNPLSIELDNTFLGETPHPSPTQLRFSQEELDFLQEEYIRNQLLFAYRDTFAEYVEVPTPELSTFFYPPDRQYILDEYTRFDTEETFNEIVYSVALRKKKERYFFKVFNKYTGTLMNETPLLLFDGIPLYDVNSLLRINSKLIEKIEVITSIYFQDSFPIHGIVSVVSFKGDASELDLPKAYVRKPYTFLSTAREFRKVAHLGEAALDKRIPDQRSTLLWEPNVRTGADGKARISGFTSDITGKFELRLKGINATGEWADKTESFTVRESSQP